MLLNERIVAVDDEPHVLTSIRLALEKYYEVICFTRGQDALNYLRKPNRINLVLLDVYMKDLDGIAVLREIKTINKNIAVIIVTALGTKDVAVQALQNGADDFIEKPFAVKEMREKAKYLLEQKVSFYKSDPESIDHMMHFVDRNYRNVTLEDIAVEMCMSAKYVSRLFQRRNKCSFRRYIIKLKLEKAKALLCKTSYHVTQIARMLGYQNAESFMRLFKRTTRLTPSQYRQKHKKRN